MLEKLVHSCPRCAARNFSVPNLFNVKTFRDGRFWLVQLPRPEVPEVICDGCGWRGTVDKLIPIVDHETADV